MADTAASGSLQLSGRIDMDSAADHLARLKRQLNGSSIQELDLSGVTGADSAALALLLELLRHGRERGNALRLGPLPPTLASLARLYGLDELLDGHCRSRS
ncbi:lipid asymmetry maintenance protein MlaB [Pseudogulbenkiania sp. MAI-1]|uniref:STAS domain-containing protein n=1 Tax=Pseudogulbenkiania sp. MAI-1 TaxID=990370 RepID=UPI00045E7CA7|nr:STAS domain-containing protein [Pseudogulbenkiania sp. MAI-1]